MTPRAVLVGLPGSGKTSTGRALARRLRLPFADSDDLVQQQTGRTVRELFADTGEAGFRAAEADVVTGALAGFDGILALGGGAVTTARVRAALHDAGVPVILLEATPATLLARIGTGATRPLLAGDPAPRLALLRAERGEAYAAVATLTVPTDGRTPAQLAAAIATALDAAAAR